MLASALLAALLLVPCTYKPPCGESLACRAEWMALGDVRVTVYQLVPWQTSDDPHTFADGTQWRDLEGEQVCALSRDMLARWGGPVEYGDTIMILGTPVDRECVVHDTMAARYYSARNGWQDVKHIVDVLEYDTIGAWDGTAFLKKTPSRWCFVGAHCVY